MPNNVWSIIWTIVIILLAITFLTLTYTTLRTIKSEGAKCQVNPLQYGIAQYEDFMNVSMICSCSFMDAKYKSIVVTRNSTKPYSADDLISANR